MSTSEDVIATASRRGRGPQLPDSLTFPGTFSLLEIAPNQRAPRVFIALMTRAPVVVNGYGGWSRVARPRDSALTEWVGRDTLSVSIDFILDDFASRRGSYVEGKCQVLEELAGVEAGNPEPPLCELHSNPDKLMPHGYARASQNKWFIDSLSWDQDLTRYNGVGNRTRAVGTVVVSVYVADERLHPAAERRKAAKKPVTKGGSRRKNYTVLPGDTLHKIAARRDTYNDWRKWKIIAKANNIHNDKQLKRHVGKVIRLP
jgi:hypothetical protein